MSEMEGHDASWPITMEAGGAPPLVGELAEMNLAHNMFEVLVPIIMFAGTGVVAGLSFGFPRCAVAMSGILTLATILIFLTIKFPRGSGFVLRLFSTRRMSEMEGHDASWPITMEAGGAPPLVGELAEMNLAHKMFEMLVPVIMFAGTGVVAGLSFGFPRYTVALFGIFTLATTLIFLKIKFPRASIAVAKKLFG